MLKKILQVFHCGGFLWLLADLRLLFGQPSLPILVLVCDWRLLLSLDKGVDINVHHFACLHLLIRVSFMALLLSH